MCLLSILVGGHLEKASTINNQSFMCQTKQSLFDKKLRKE